MRDVGELVGEHGLHLGCVEPVEQATGNDDRAVPRAPAEREGGRHRRFLDRESRHGEPSETSDPLERLDQLGRLGPFGEPDVVRPEGRGLERAGGEHGNAGDQESHRRHPQDE